MSTRTLAQWLDDQQRVSGAEIALGLDRIRRVWLRLGAPGIADVVISVAGTNGKGSTVAFVEAMARAAGLRVGAYTSPHLIRYNERVRIDGIDADDAALVAAFERIESVRDDVPLTFFEFGTLAALLLFADAKLDLAILEVGLGGRLDAVNVIDADAAIVTTIDLDHQDWLGRDRDTIGREKAGVLRAAKPAIIGERSPPMGLIDAARGVGARLVRAGIDYRVERRFGHWLWSTPQHRLELPMPRLAAAAQIDNAAAAIAALHAVRGQLGWNPQAMADGVRAARAAARMQRLLSPDGVELLVDVAHNPQAARQLADWLLDHPPGGNELAVFGALSDKDVAGISEVLMPVIDRWALVGLDHVSPRGLGADELCRRSGFIGAVELHPDVDTALAVWRDARAGDRIVAFGSFHIAGPSLAWAASHGFRDIDLASAGIDERDQPL